MCSGLFYPRSLRYHYSQAGAARPSAASNQFSETISSSHPHRLGGRLILKLITSSSSSSSGSRPSLPLGAEDDLCASKGHRVETSRARGWDSLGAWLALGL